MQRDWTDLFFCCVQYPDRIHGTGLGISEIYEAFELLLAGCAGLYDHDCGNLILTEIADKISTEERCFSRKRITFQQCGDCSCGCGLCGDHYDSQYLRND